MIKVAIIDDEPAAISILNKACEESGLGLQIVGTASSIATATKLIHDNEPDVVLLDVEFPEGTGFEVLEGCEGLNFQVVFVTAHESYAIQALRHHALDYILKPANAEEIVSALSKAIKQIEQNKTARWDELLTYLKGNKTSKFQLPIKDGYRYIDLSTLVYLQADGSYASLHFTDGTKTLASKKLSWFEARIGDQGFVRVHRSYLVNTEHIIELHRNDGGYIVTTTGDRVAVSKNYRP